MKKNLLLGGILALSLFGCGESSDSGEAQNEINEETLLSDDSNADESSAISDSLIQTLNSIPSPIETAFQIKENGGDYNANFLNSTDNSDQYETNSVLALNLGIYSADLAYCNIYESQDAITYLGAVASVASDLGLEEHFDVEGMSKLMSGENNLDSLLQITTEKFEVINKQLQEDGKSHFSVLMLAGGWLEGLHLLGSVYQTNPSEQLKERIGEQKIVLTQLVSLISFYKDKDETIATIFNNYSKLNAIFEQIKIERIESDEVEMKLDPVLGIYVATPKSTSKIIVNDEQITNIINIVNETRNFITTQN